MERGIRTCLVLRLHNPSLWLFVPNSKLHNVFPLNVTFCITKWKVLSSDLVSTKTVRTICYYGRLINTNYDSCLMHDTRPTNIGIVIGNGKSRQGINLTHFFTKNPKNYNNTTVYGCNDIFKEYTPDVLVAVDDRAISRVSDSNYTGSFYTPETLVGCFSKCKHLIVNSGACIICASYHYGNHDVIFLLGFDFCITLAGRSNNMYYDNPTGQYNKGKTLAEEYITALENTGTSVSKFIRVVDKKYSKKTKSSITTIAIEDFLKIRFT